MSRTITLDLAVRFASAVLRFPYYYWGSLGEVPEEFEALKNGDAGPLIKFLQAGETGEENELVELLREIEESVGR